MKPKPVLAAALLVIMSASGLAAQAPPASARVPTTRVAPDEFGTNDYVVTTIPCFSFTTDSQDWGDCQFGDTHGPPYDGGHEFAGVNVPAGAVIDFVGLQSCPGVIPTLTATLFYVDRYSGTTSGIVSVAEGSSCGTIYNASPLGWQLMANAHNALVVDVYQPSGNETGFLEWVEIWWKRAVSPPPATPSFTDVPMSDFGYQYIEALKASGITGGCGDGTTFCPDANLTRRQMAIFLAKALGLHWPN